WLAPAPASRAAARVRVQPEYVASSRSRTDLPATSTSGSSSRRATARSRWAELTSREVGSASPARGRIAPSTGTPSNAETPAARWRTNPGRVAESIATIASTGGAHSLRTCSSRARREAGPAPPRPGRRSARPGGPPPRDLQAPAFQSGGPLLPRSDLDPGAVQGRRGARGGAGIGQHRRGHPAAIIAAATLVGLAGGGIIE